MIFARCGARRCGLFSRSYLYRHVFTGYPRVSDAINFYRERMGIAWQLPALLPAVTYANYVSVRIARARSCAPQRTLARSRESTHVRHCTIVCPLCVPIPHCALTFFSSSRSLLLLLLLQSVPLALARDLHDCPCRRYNLWWKVSRSGNIGRSFRGCSSLHTHTHSLSCARASLVMSDRARKWQRR